MMELAKLAPLIKGWPWPKVSYVLGVCLLYKQLVTFDQAIALILLAVALERLAQPTTGRKR
jgi:hypothetical protein